MNDETNTTQPAVVLRAPEANRVSAGHPWIYERGIQRVQGAPEDGAVVAVSDPRRRFLGVGCFNSRSKLRVRMYSHHNVELDRAFFLDRLREALALRERRLPGARACRIINAEADFLSGLIVDRYEDVLVTQISALALEQRKALIFDALEELLHPRAIVERNDIAARRFEGLDAASGVARGEFAGEVTFTLNGLTFIADPLAGQKTGFYLDQQVNHRLVADWLKDRPNARVADCFCSSGAFALHAARAGAAQVVGIDQSETSVATARRLAEQNDLADRCVFETANVFDWLKARSTPAERDQPGEQFDAVILDPPSFTRNRASLPNALRGYKEIHVRALKLIRPGGLLATFCCSHHVDERTFRDVALSAAFDTRRVLRLVTRCTQAPDHPIIPSIPETEYLKGALYEVVR
jgi:23S rRNA (cytosine1962-C5)-methyltransferase